MEDEEEKERGRVETLLKIRQTSVDMKPELWLATQEARFVGYFPVMGTIVFMPVVVAAGVVV